MKNEQSYAKATPNPRYHILVYNNRVNSGSNNYIPYYTVLTNPAFNLAICVNIPYGIKQHEGFKTTEGRTKEMNKYETKRKTRIVK